MSLRINCIICTTAMNYLYASLDKNLGQHDVICSNKDIAFWIKKNYSRGLRDVHILNFHPKYNYLKNHFFDSSENLLWKKLKSNKYQNYYLSFCSGWHFNWMQKKLNLKFSQIILLDDGIGNTLLVPTKFFILKKIISFLISLRINSFSRYRDFNNPNIENIITIYGKLNNFSFHKPKNIINISENFRSKIIDNIQKNNLLFKNKYGIYIASLQGVHSKDKTILKKIKKELTFLKRKPMLNGLLKLNLKILI